MSIFFLEFIAILTSSTINMKSFLGKTHLTQTRCGFFRTYRINGSYYLLAHMTTSESCRSIASCWKVSFPLNFKEPKILIILSSTTMLHGASTRSHVHCVFNIEAFFFTLIFGLAFIVIICKLYWMCNIYSCQSLCRNSLHVCIHNFFSFLEWAAVHQKHVSNRSWYPKDY